MQEVEAVHCPLVTLLRQQAFGEFETELCVTCVSRTVSVATACSPFFWLRHPRITTQPASSSCDAKAKPTPLLTSTTQTE